MYAARRAALAFVVDRDAELRGDERLVAAGAERAPEVLLAQGAAVDVGGVEQRDAGVERGVDDRLRRRLVDAATEVVAAEADDRRGQRTDGACLHEPSLSDRRGRHRRLLGGWCDRRGRFEVVRSERARSSSTVGALVSRNRHACRTTAASNLHTPCNLTALLTMGITSSSAVAGP